MKAMHKRILIGIIFISTILILRLSPLGSYLDLENIRHNSIYLQQRITAHYVPAILIFIMLYVAIILSAIPVSPAFNIASGYFFGVIPGALYSIFGATIGVTIAFFIFRYLLREYVQEKYGYRLKRFNKEFKKEGVSYLLFMQLLPIMPFSVITILCGLSNMSWWTFVWVTMLGITPGSFIYAFAGRQFMYIEKASDVLSWPLILSLTLLAGLALLPLLMRKLSRKTFQSNEHDYGNA
jgi:uncharacterized membrane protein YdjX (TVP38/TMEM64 family)